jgi:hypothetical protein
MKSTYYSQYFMKDTYNFMDLHRYVKAQKTEQFIKLLGQ